MAKDKRPRENDLPIGAEHEEKRAARPGRAAVEKAPPEACAIRPVVIKLHGLAPFEGEMQGTVDHVKVVVGKYRLFFGPLFEWAEVEGDRV